jgi:uncharacterized cupredoxin-like copper-binding protein
VRVLRILVPLAFAGLAASCAPAGAHGAGEPRTIEISMHFSAFDPDEIRVEPGETVRFVLTNTDPIDHEFILGDARVQRIHEDGTEMEHGAKPGEITIHAGTTAETTYTFPDAGEVLFGCHSPGHYAYGMRGVVVVDP